MRTFLPTGGQKPRRECIVPGLIVHDWLARTGGAEKVVDQFARVFPDAAIRVLWDDAPGRFGDRVQETWLARTPLRHCKPFALPLMPATWRFLAERADWLLVSSHLFAHHARLRNDPACRKLVYAHTPARYIWSPEHDDRGRSPLVAGAARILRPLDRRRAQEASAVAANSVFTRERIERSWGRDATVIYPPVDTERISAVASWADQLDAADQATLEALPSTYVVGASRFITYKRLELVIEAGEAVGLPVVLAGDGPQLENLLARAEHARVPVTVVRRPSTPLLYALLQRAHVLVFPAVEDFGILPVEAMAAGTPVIVPTVGGAAESADLLEGGVAVEAFSLQTWRDAFARLGQIDRVGLPTRAARFSCSRFRSEIQAWVSDTTQQPQRTSVAPGST